ncbi:capsular polysaccharide biosynthesis protein/Mrp family chromosome partitioning ATPase [Allocatelliglobosispora scoriae]|uniref:Capsular polysaccharide biosynthesis protein/Mrp family chromosome partitioning ATPase n=1 Tax=Allocatelliglobosispora scoriae TaxID=643052 RepID=A0A841BVU7_9ACTN|nr:lipopolysaccharide biosynthesis protein [Allocatelliglobosispora scoriae]MBB5871606.1 capsular polysaccharide biosynthesis protein/Mrp family chromosome partitioning ATPase [Allocatelliglobosispora scoriae]
MDVMRPPSLDISDYLGMARRHWWIVALTVSAGIGGASALTSHLPKEYVSVTSVLVQPAGGDANAVGGRTRGEINLDTEAQLLQSTAVANGAAELLRIKTDARELAARVDVEVPPNSTVLQIKFAAPTPTEAQAGSHAFAESYLRNRDANAKFELTRQITSLTAKVKQLNGQLGTINARLDETAKSTPTQETLETQRSTVLTQLNQLTGQLNQLTTATVSAGRIISDAGLPNRSVKPDVMINLATGAMAGLLGGLGLAALRQRLDRRCRRRSDVSRRADVPVLAEIPGKARLRFDDIFAPNDLGGRTFNRLRNEVLAALTQGGGERAPQGAPGSAAPGDGRSGARVLVVTGASRGTASTVVASNLAAALARTGSDVILVGARQPESMVGLAPLARLVGVAPTPGLSDVITGRCSLDTAIQRAPRLPSLRVLPTGGTASAGGVLQSQTLRDTMAALRARCEFVVIEAPSTASGADAQSLAGVADAAIIAVELRRTTYPQVRDAADQLHRVGTPVLGAVLTPKLKPVAELPPVPPSIDTVMLAKLDAETLAALDAEHGFTAPHQETAPDQETASHHESDTTEHAAQQEGAEVK